MRERCQEERENREGKEAREGGWRRKKSSVYVCIHLLFFQTHAPPLLGNKGAVGISFYFGSLSLCFVSSHLTSGSEKCHRSVRVWVFYGHTSVM